MGRPSNVCRDFKLSPYTWQDKNGCIFVFSSDFNLQRFIIRRTELTEKMKIEFESKYRVPVDVEDYATIVAYHTTEKRGFRIYHPERGEAKWLENLRLDGVIKILKKSDD